MCLLRHLAVPLLQQAGNSSSRCLIRRISTLNPTKLCASDYLDWGGVGNATAPVESLAQKAQVRFFRRAGSAIAFPCDTQGFLYYHPGPLRAPIAGELRFRRTTGPDPASFHEGHDLRHPITTLPWNVPLPALMKAASYAPLVELLFNEGDAATRKSIRALRNTRISCLPNSKIIHSAGQPIFLDLKSKQLNLYIAHGDTMSSFTAVLLCDSRSQTSQIAPYEGSVLGSFERVLGGRDSFLVYRVLQIIETPTPKDPNYDGHIPIPRAGQLLESNGGHVWRFAFPGPSNIIEHLPATYISAKRIRPIRPSPSSSSWQVIPKVTKLKTVHHLSPDNLAPEDFMDFTDGTRVLLNRDRLHISYYPSALVPAGSAGFFYVHLPDPAHPIGATLRFKVTNNPDPSSFASGRDLCLPGPENLPWTKCIPSLVHGQTVGGDLSRKLCEEGIIREEILDFWKLSRPAGHINSRILTDASQTFVIDFSSRTNRLDFGRGKFHKALRWWRMPDRAQNWSIREGRVLVCLEEVPQQQTYNLRILKIFEPLVRANTTVNDLAPASLEVGDVISPSWWKRIGAEIWQFWHSPSV